jgi:hypothetical protein
MASRDSRITVGIGLALSLAVAAPPTIAQQGAQVPEWGTARTGVVTVGAAAFMAVDGDANGCETLYVADDYARRCPGWLVASLALPDGALLTGLAADGCDSAQFASLEWQLVVCPTEAPTVGSCVKYPATPASSGGVVGCGRFSTELSSFALTVDNDTNSYSVQARTGADATVALRAVRAYYKLQISPAPASASFTDVPVGHPAFQVVEALKASGVTQGCTATEFCPNQAVTRQQMATFLARALGLHWGPPS